MMFHSMHIFDLADAAGREARIVFADYTYGRNEIFIVRKSYSDLLNHGHITHGYIPNIDRYYRIDWVEHMISFDLNESILCVASMGKTKKRNLPEWW